MIAAATLLVVSGENLSATMVISYPELDSIRARAVERPHIPAPTIHTEVVAIDSRIKVEMRTLMSDGDDIKKTYTLGINCSTLPPPSMFGITVNVLYKPMTKVA